MEYNPNNFIHKACLICLSENIHDLRGYIGKGLIRCNNCGFVFMKSIPTNEELTSYYSSYSYSKEQYLSPITIDSYNLLLYELECFRKTNKILDVGCGVGFFLQQAKKRGWDAYGTEFSNKAVEICKDKGINIEQGVLDISRYENESFDVITSIEVLEHINNPKEEIEKICNLLRRGGLFYCTTPNFNSLSRYYLKANYYNIVYPEHLAYFTKSTLTQLAKKEGLRTVKFLSTGFSISAIKISKGKSDENPISEESSDELLRNQISKNWHLKILKKIINKMLTLTNTGDTLKGYFEKQK
ncbi:MAG: class I SAM-dependent methyltransferase [Bacteroidia bacterium]|nr:class I SAM-dependent methyltransferase [Bacteroidia bacterium]